MSVLNLREKIASNDKGLRRSHDLPKKALDDKIDKTLNEFEDSSISKTEFYGLIEIVDPTWRKIRRKVKNICKNSIEEDFSKGLKKGLKKWEFKKGGEAYQCLPGCGYCCEEARKKIKENDLIRLSEYLKKNNRVFSSYYKEILPEIKKLGGALGIDSEILPLEFLLKYNDARKTYEKRSRQLTVLNTKNHLWGKLNLEYININNCLFYSNACSIHPKAIGKEIRPACCNSVCVEGYKPKSVREKLQLP